MDRVIGAVFPALQGRPVVLQDASERVVSMVQLCAAPHCYESSVLYVAAPLLPTARARSRDASHRGPDRYPSASTLRDRTGMA